METKWLVDSWLTEIEQVEAVEETARFINVRTMDKWRHDIRQRKDGKIFDTYEEAKAALVAHATRRVASAEQELLLANKNLAKAKALQRPSTE